MPSEFRGKDFKGIASAATMQNWADGFALKSMAVKVTGYDHANARMKISGTCVAMYVPKLSDKTKIDFQITYLVIV